MSTANPAPQIADPLTLATLALCTASYLPDITTIPAAVTQTPPLTAGGQWQCIWGPVQDSDQSNLALVAGYFPSPNAGPQTVCVTVRGTDFDITDIWGMLEQIWEDLDACDPQPMPWALNDPARIASGTLDGLAVMQGLTANGQTLGQFLTNFFSQAANANVTILVTGHSLGGCLATIVATWIRVLLPAQSSRSRSRRRPRATRSSRRTTTSCFQRRGGIRIRSTSSRSPITTSAPSTASTRTTCWIRRTSSGSAC